MKVTNLRRKLAAALVAGGTLIPVAAPAADLDTNLVVNGGFENVDTGTTGAYNSVLILDWNQVGGGGFAYSHDGSGGAPDYANGEPPVGGGSYYFTPGSLGRAQSFANALKQEIDVSTGATGSAIAAGDSTFSIKATFGSYATQTDHGVVDVEFLNSSGGVLGTGQITPGSVNLTQWTDYSHLGIVPAGTTSARISAWGVLEAGGTADGYMDNIDFRVLEGGATDLAMFLEVNTSSGDITLRNQTDEAVAIDYYEIMSNGGAGNSLLAGDANWTSFQDENAAGFPAGNGSGNGWEEAGGADSDTLSESFWLGSSNVLPGASISLGNAFNTSQPQDLTFRYGVVESTSPTGDYNGDGTVNIADYTVWRNTLGATVPQGTGADGDGDGTIGPGDYTEWKENFGSTGDKGPGTLVTGFVKYVSSGSVAATNVPEPSSVVIVSMAVAGIFGATQLRGRES
ncbi:dockerin type I domain-containing protein [Aeoliella sp.]|uniref:dockerin type I domain-containing protein n=1 Tax=Aeoliella sp. TaxID=2795800 RepID=UPI003CCBE991